MDISGISSSLSTNSFLSSAARADLQPAEHGKKSEETHRHHGHRRGGHHGRALGAFGQELRIALKAHFHAKFSTTQQGYAQVSAAASSDDVAAEALGAANQIVAESPTTAAKSLISFRAKVHEAASFVRETVGAPEGDDDVENAVARVDEGLDTLENEVARNRESVASVLTVDTRTKQRSTIKIRTQEGDVVKLSLRRTESMSASDVAVSDGNGFASSTEVEVSSRSRMMLRVEGDLNESELEAIQNVFAQAEQIADEFFGGDIRAAFDLAAGFEFDTEQLARVNMKFRMRQDSTVSYAESVRPASLAGAGAPAIAAPGPTAGSGPTSPPIVETHPATEVPIAAPADVAVADQAVATEPATISPPATSALASFFDALSTFLRTVGEGFEGGSSSGSFRFHYSESFKLELLKSVIHTVAPDESTDAAIVAGSVIDNIIEAATIENSDS